MIPKYYINGYICDNLGDDLIIQTLCQRYPNTQFISYTDKKSNAKIASNLKIIKLPKIISGLIRKTAKLFKTDSIMESIIANRCKASITAAGSIFMQRKDGTDSVKYGFYKRLQKQKTPYYIIGSNVGPVYSPDFVQKIKDNVIDKAKFVAVRDRASYSSIEGKNVKLASDIVFSNKTIRQLPNGNTIIFSIINCKNGEKNNRKITNQEYESFIKAALSYYSSKNKEIVLFSFCASEGDEDAVNSYAKWCESKHIAVKCYNYNGNIEEAIRVFEKAHTIVASRFHATILGIIMGKKVIPIDYNGKTTNILRDSGYKGPIIDHKNIKSQKMGELDNDREALTINTIAELAKKSECNFLALDKILK